MNVQCGCVSYEPDCPLARNLHDTWESEAMWWHCFA